MSSVWYIGSADVKIMYYTDWAYLGISAPTNIWDEFNGWSVSQSVFTAPQLAILNAHNEFQITVDDGPRPGYSITDDPERDLSRSEILELIELAGGQVNSVNGRKDDVILTKADVTLQNVDNTTDALKPISNATQTALNLKAPLLSPTFTGTVSGITATMVGLGSVNNTADTAKPVSTAQQTALNLKANIASPTFTGTVGGITATMVGLGSVNNTSDANKPVSTAQAAADALKANIASPTFTGTVAGITATMVGLGNVDNTSDVNKPVSTAQAVADALAIPLTQKAAAFGVPALDGSGKILTSYLTVNSTGNPPTLGTGTPVGSSQPMLAPEQIPVAQSYLLNMGSLTGAITPNADLTIQRYRKITATDNVTINVPTFTTITNGVNLEGYEIDFMIQMTHATLGNRTVTVNSAIKLCGRSATYQAAAQNGFVYLKIKYNSFLAAWFLLESCLVV